VGLLGYTDADDCFCFSSCVADGLDFWAIGVDGFLDHSLEESVVFGWGTFQVDT